MGIKEICKQMAKTDVAIITFNLPQYHSFAEFKENEKPYQQAVKLYRKMLFHTFTRREIDTNHGNLQNNFSGAVVLPSYQISSKIHTVESVALGKLLAVLIEKIPVDSIILITLSRSNAAGMK